MSIATPIAEVSEGENKSPATMRRTLVFPVAEAVGATWSEFRKALRSCLDESTAAANIIVSGMFAQDAPAPPRLPGEKLRLPKVKIDGKPIYAAVTAAVPGLPTGTVASVMQRIRGVYLKKRFEVMGTHASSVPTFRWPYPFYVRSQSYKLVHVQRPDADYWLIEFSTGSRLADDSRARFTLRLAGGREMRRQSRSLASAVGTGDCSITMRSDGKVLVNLSVELLRADREGKTGTATVTTGGGSFMRFGGDCWLKPLHADHVRGWIAEHAIRRQRLADDLKYEKRWPRRMREGIQEKLASVCARHAARVGTFVDQASAMAVGFCVRNRLAALTLDTRDRSFVPQFPWFMLSDKFRQKCEACSIEFKEIKNDDTTAPAEPKGDAGPGDVAPMAVSETSAPRGAK